MTTEEAPAKKKAAPGWYPDPKLPNTRRYWTGDGWTDERHQLRYKPGQLAFGDRPEGLIVWSFALAVMVGVVGGAVYTAEHAFGMIILIVGGVFASIFFQVGIIAKGVELGIRAARHRADLDF
jgi:hypothetical protein